MEYLNTSRTPHDHLRIVFRDRVASLPIDAGTTLGDVAQAVRELGPRQYGDPLAIDVAAADVPARSFSSDFLRAGMKFEDDPAAEFDSMMPDPTFRPPNHAIRYDA